MIRLRVVNCVHANTEPARFVTCAIGCFGGRPAAVKCKRCPDRDPRDAAAEIVSSIDAPAPEADTAVVANDDEVAICRSRLVEEWGDDWRDKLAAAAVRSSDRRIIVPRALYEEAMRNRKR